MFNLNDSVFISNRGIKELGKIVKKYRKNKVQYYDVLTERQIKLEMLSTDDRFPTYVITSKLSPL